jgi:hypothetical protein
MVHILNGVIQGASMSKKKAVNQEFEEGLYTGEWEEGQPEGFGTWSSSFGGESFIIYSGEWKDGQKHGYGTEIYNSQMSVRIYKGQWCQGQKDDGRGTAIEF